MPKTAPDPHADTRPDAAHAPRVAVIISRYNASITDRLLDGALRAYAQAYPSAPAPTVADAPGAFELVALSAAAARSGRFHAVVALGCVVKGETSHDEYINHAVAHGLAQLSADTGIPAAFGLLTVRTPRQARDRAGGVMGNKGAEAMQAALATLAAIRTLTADTPAPAGSATPRPDKTRPNTTRTPAAATTTGGAR